MITGFGVGFVVSIVLCLVFRGLLSDGILMYRAFSYNGKRQLSRDIVEGTAQHMMLPDDGKCLDVGCGSGALTIALGRV